MYELYAVWYSMKYNLLSFFAKYDNEKQNTQK